MDRTIKHRELSTVSTPLKNDGVKVSWDDDIPKWMESHNPVMFQSPPTSTMVSSYKSYEIPIVFCLHPSFFPIKMQKTLPSCGNFTGDDGIWPITIHELTQDSSLRQASYFLGLPPFDGEYFGGMSTENSWWMDTHLSWISCRHSFWFPNLCGLCIAILGYPLVICYIAIENDHRNSGFSH